jgi:hypothetical protein
MDEEIDLAHALKQLGQPPPARSGNVRPAIAQLVGHRRAHLLAPEPVHRRQIDAPEMAVAVAPECL